MDLELVVAIIPLFYGWWEQVWTRRHHQQPGKWTWCSNPRLLLMLRTIPTVDPTRFMASLCLERKRYRKSSHTSSPNLINPTFSFLQRSNSSTTSQSNEAKSAQPQTLEELLERQWEQGSQFLMEQASHFDSKLIYHTDFNEKFAPFNFCKMIRRKSSDF